MLYSQILKTPIGEMIAACNKEGLCLFDFKYRKSICKIINRIETFSGEQMVENEYFIFNDLKQQIDEYFLGTRQTFHLPLVLLGTPFQIKVWEALKEIPYGDTRTYQQQAQTLGNEKAIRAIATANGNNGIAIIIPCHRVIGKDGSLTGYGGGLDKKDFLLKHESKFAQNKNQINLFS